MSYVTFLNTHGGHGHRWRERELPPAETVELLLRQIVAGNIPCAEVRCFRDGAFTASAYCQARARLPVHGVWELLRQVNAELCGDGGLCGEGGPCAGGGRWRGHRTLHVDGTGFSMPDTPQLQAVFGQPGGQKPGCGFPVAHLLTAFDAATGMILQAHPAPLRTHDLSDIRHVHAQMSAGDVLIGDKAFGSWGHLAILQAGAMHGIFPLHQARKIAGTRGTGQQVGRFDRIECWSKPRQRPVWMDESVYALLPGKIQVRVIRRSVPQGRGRKPLTVTLVTTLLDKQTYPADAVVRLAGGRWDAETNLRHLKITLGLDVLRCKSVDGVLRELAAIVLVYNLVRAVMHKAAARQGVAAARISFADALRFIRWSGTGDELYDLTVNPLRPGRVEPRAVKRRGDNHNHLTRPRDVMRKELETRAKMA